MDDLAALFKYLDEHLSVEEKANISSLESPKCGEMRLGLNALIRSVAFYKNDSPVGKLYFARAGLADDAGSAFGELYWRHLKGMTMTRGVIIEALESGGWTSPQGEQAISIAEDLLKSYMDFHNA
jgi:hypothetical protein